MLIRRANGDSNIYNIFSQSVGSFKGIGSNCICAEKTVSNLMRYPKKIVKEYKHIRFIVFIYCYSTIKWFSVYN